MNGDAAGANGIVNDGTRESRNPRRRGFSFLSMTDVCNTRLASNTSSFTRDSIDVELEYITKSNLHNSTRRMKNLN